ncbi:MAG: glycerol-3-phosphate 1-O-acyltransferase PlsB [Xanthomonadales bacterium]|nr:glycerol-3-phosphate 1-O-acyltransferase PlsB [Xanthomonadales bacterium]
MSESPEVPASASVPDRRISWPYRFLGWIMRPWIEIRREPTVGIDELVRPGLPVCYVAERYGLSTHLILEQATAEAGLPSPLLPIRGNGGNDLLGKGRAMFALSRRQGFGFGRPRSLSHPESLARLVQQLRDDPDLDVQLVPVSLFVGRAPDREEGWFSVLFSENWGVVGRFRRLLAILLNGRNTLVRFSPPVSLREVLAEGLTPERSVRKIARVLRAHFRRIRTAVIGPDLSHRRTLVDGLLANETVSRVIAEQARKEGIAEPRVRDRARRMAREIAADYSNPVVRSLSFILKPFWNKLYDGIEMHHFDTLRDVAPGHEIIYVPCHRSHIDYLLLSYLLYQHNIVPPHIAAGDNLNLPIVGPILRRGGAFFLRRSFKSNALYSTIFSEYVAMLIDRGVSIEYFIEGGRSRTGRLLPPKGGMLAMTVRGFLRRPRRPVVFQPVYIGYEKLMEARSYQAELSGKAKQKESLLGLLRAFGVLRHRYGKVAVNFGQPIFLSEVLDERAPAWRDHPLDSDEKPGWLNPAVDALGERILVEINRAADVNPIGLLAQALLATPNHAMSESDLLEQLAVSQTLLASSPYSDRVTITQLEPAQIIAYGEKMEVLSRTPHSLGDVIALSADKAVVQRYFRNNLLHLFAAASWIACCFQNNRRMSRAGVVRLGRLLYPFIRNELFLPWTEEQFGERLQATIGTLCDLKLLGFDPDSGQLSRDKGQTDSVFQLRVIAHSLQPAFERYYLAIAILVRNGSGNLSVGELEKLCKLTAQRLTLLHAPTAPEYFDRALFRGFLNRLREAKVLWTTEDGKLAFDERMDGWSRDAKVILGRELRHSIQKMAPATTQPEQEAPKVAAESETE